MEVKSTETHNIQAIIYFSKLWNFFHCQDIAVSNVESLLKFHLEKKKCVTPYNCKVVFEEVVAAPLFYNSESMILKRLIFSWSISCTYAMKLDNFCLPESVEYYFLHCLEWLLLRGFLVHCQSHFLLSTERLLLEMVDVYDFTDRMEKEAPKVCYRFTVTEEIHGRTRKITYIP